MPPRIAPVQAVVIPIQQKKEGVLQAANALLESLQAETLDGPRVRESQEEIAELFSVSKGKLNPLMQSLVASGCIQKYRARSGYTITPLGAQVVRHIGQLDALAHEDVVEV